jgi:hypothetical protein
VPVLANLEQKHSALVEKCRVLDQQAESVYANKNHYKHQRDNNYRNQLTLQYNQKISAYNECIFQMREVESTINVTEEKMNLLKQ